MNVHEQRYNALRGLVDRRLRQLVRKGNPKDVNDACRYVLSAGGKRVRSTLVLLSCEAVGGRAEAALDVGAAVELMHNFTLVHDDIMDNARSRRGRPTVHTKWSVNNALLVGDILLGLAFHQSLKRDTARLHRVLNTFTKGLLDVCEGQALDLEFEHRRGVSVREYFDMIEKKTGRLIATAAELGGILGGGSERQIAALKVFGRYLGRAFQVQDDLLDVVAEEKDFGKVIGGDILEGKKTFLLLKALERGSGNQRALLQRVMHRKTFPPPRTATARKREVRRIAAIYRETGAIAAAQRKIHDDTRRAEAALASLPASRSRDTLHWFSHMLLTRQF